MDQRASRRSSSYLLIGWDLIQCWIMAVWVSEELIEWGSDGWSIIAKARNPLNSNPCSYTHCFNPFSPAMLLFFFSGRVLLDKRLLLFLTPSLPVHNRRVSKSAKGIDAPHLHFFSFLIKPKKTPLILAIHATYSKHTTSPNQLSGSSYTSLLFS